jgi:hypothetical protein
MRSITGRLARAERTIGAMPAPGDNLDLTGDTMPAELARRYDDLLATTGAGDKRLEGLAALFERVTRRLESEFDKQMGTNSK